MKHDCINLIDDQGIEIAVGFDYELAELEDSTGWYIELSSVEIIIKGKGIDILPSMTDKQGGHIVQLIAEELDREAAERVKHPYVHPLNY